MIYKSELKIKAEKEKLKEEFNKKFYAIQRQIEYCNRSNENNLIHPKINEICKEIKSTSFKDRVIGPICDFIKLKTKKL